MSWSAAEAAAIMAAPGVAVSTPRAAGAGTVTAEDRRAEEDAVSARLDTAWRRLAEARTATEGRSGTIGDDTARRDPVTQPFPIVFGTAARPARGAARPAQPPAAHPAPRPVPAAPHRLRPAGQLHRARPPRRLTVDRWSAAVG